MHTKVYDTIESHAAHTGKVRIRVLWPYKKVNKSTLGLRYECIYFPLNDGSMELLTDEDIIWEDMGEISIKA